MFKNMSPMDKAVKIIGIIILIFLPIALRYGNIRLYIIITSIYIIATRIIEWISKGHEASKFPISISILIMILLSQLYAIFIR